MDEIVSNITGKGYDENAPSYGEEDYETVPRFAKEDDKRVPPL
jgi:hypothetical protein